MYLIHIAAIDGQAAGGQPGRIGLSHGNILSGDHDDPALRQHKYTVAGAAAVLAGDQVGRDLRFAVFAPYVDLASSLKIYFVIGRIIGKADAFIGKHHTGITQFLQTVRLGIINREREIPGCLRLFIPAAVGVHHQRQQFIFLIGYELPDKLGIVPDGLAALFKVVAQKA